MGERTTAAKRPTIRDVAAAAGVSRGTVSRYMNGGHWVSPEARAAIEEAIARTGYTANQHARSLATGRAQSLAFLVTEPQQLLFADPTYARLLRGAAEALAQRSMTLVLLVASTSAERETVTHFVQGGHVDGVMLISSHEADPLLERLVAAGVPTVSCGIPLGHDVEVGTVSVDEEESARTMARYLRERGYRRIAMIAGPADTPGGRYRLKGFRDELGEAFDPELVADGDYSFASGAKALDELLRADRDFDAVFAANDLMAAGAVSALRHAGLRVPEDVAVAGFDDSGLAEANDPPLTTMRQPWEQISAEMVAMLLELVEGASPRAVTLPTTLVRRASA